MIPFDRERPDDDSSVSFRLLRTPPVKPFIAIVTSAELVGTRTHFAGRRTTPCTRTSFCPLCKTGHGWRWHAYVSCILADSGEHVLFETTAQASDAFKAYFKQHKLLRGAKFKATRVPQVANGRVVVRCAPADLTNVTLPDPPMIEEVLCHIWGIPTSDQTTKSNPDREATEININRPNHGNGVGRLPLNEATKR